MPVVNTSSTYVHVLFYDIKYISTTSMWFFKALTELLKTQIFIKKIKKRLRVVGSLMVDIEVMQP